MTTERSRFEASLRTASPTTVSVGAGGITFLALDELDAGQVGYARTPEGRDLTGTGEGDWRSSWLVFACETGLGDPIFVDLADATFPVFSAMHGAGSWDPTLIAESFQGFIRALGVLRHHTKGRTNMIELEERPFTARELEELVADLECVGPSANRSFWTGWLESLE